MNINGLVRIPGSSQKKKYFFSFDGKSLLIYKNNAIPLEDYELKENVKIKSSYYKCLIGEKYGNNLPVFNNKKCILFFIQDNDFIEKRISNSNAIESLPQIIEIEIPFYIDDCSINNPFAIQEIQLAFPELDYFFHIGGKGLLIKTNFLEFKIIPYKKNKVSFSFNIENNIKIRCEIGVVHTLLFNSKTPLKLQSLLTIHFEKTNDIDFIVKLYKTIQNLFRYLCYRKSINIEFIKLLKKEKNKPTFFASLYINTDEFKEDEKAAQSVVEYDFVKEKLSKLIQLIANQMVCLEYLPAKKADQRIVRDHNTIAIVSAFESNIKRLYSDESNNSKKIAVLIERMLDKFNNIIEPLTPHLYRLYQIEKASNKDIALSITSERNTYAHGYISTEENKYFPLSFSILAYLNYCMVLSYAGYSDADILRIIKKIFNINE